MPRRVFYLGRWIRHSGWYPGPPGPALPEDPGPAGKASIVHESLVYRGRARPLGGRIHHFTYRNIADHLARINNFSDLGAQKLYAGGRKARWYHLAGLPFVRFLKSYLCGAGSSTDSPGSSSPSSTATPSSSATPSSARSGRRESGLSLFHIDAGKEWRGGQRQSLFLVRELRKRATASTSSSSREPPPREGRRAELPVLPLRMRMRARPRRRSSGWPGR